MTTATVVACSHITDKLWFISVHIVAPKNEIQVLHKVLPRVIMNFTAEPQASIDMGLSSSNRINHSALVSLTSAEWDCLKAHKKELPESVKAAIDTAIKAAIDAALAKIQPKLTEHRSAHHLPFVTDEEKGLYDVVTLRHISVVRCTELALNKLVGSYSIEEELAFVAVLPNSWTEQVLLHIITDIQPLRNSMHNAAVSSQE